MLSGPARKFVAEVTRLEVVVTVAKRQPHTLHLPPIANIYLEPSLSDAGWLGAVDGELINDDPVQILQNAQLSAVVLDAGGNVVGGTAVANGVVGRSEERRLGKERRSLWSLQN